MTVTTSLYTPCSYEPLFNQYGVDLVIHGHVHSYERTNPVFQYKADATGCAPTYVTIGDGGNLEKVGSMILVIM